MFTTWRTEMLDVASSLPNILAADQLRVKLALISQVTLKIEALFSGTMLLFKTMRALLSCNRLSHAFLAPDIVCA